jgi:E3 ubiquitin-protein ligase MGRN1
MDTGKGTVRLLRRKFLTPMGLYTMDEAFGLNSDRTAGEDSKECVICLTDRKDTLARPCKHVTMCNACAKVVMRTDHKCPLCR